MTTLATLPAGPAAAPFVPRDLTDYRMENHGGCHGVFKPLPGGGHYAKAAYWTDGKSCTCPAGEEGTPCKHAWLASLIRRCFPSVGDVCEVMSHWRGRAGTGEDCTACGSETAYLRLYFPPRGDVAFYACLSCDWRKVI